MADEVLADRRAARQHTEHPWREASLLERLRDVESVQRSLRSRLKHHRAAGQQRIDDLVERLQEGTVPRGHRHHPHRLEADQRVDPAVAELLDDDLPGRGAGVPNAADRYGAPIGSAVPASAGSSAISDASVRASNWRTTAAPSWRAAPVRRIIERASSTSLAPATSVVPVQRAPFGSVRPDEPPFKR